MAFQPRVIKQNRGSSGEGIWIIKLKEGNYCSTFGERVCEGSEVLDMMEANDNHAEERTATVHHGLLRCVVLDSSRLRVHYGVPSGSSLHRRTAEEHTQRQRNKKH